MPLFSSKITFRRIKMTLGTFIQSLTFAGAGLAAACGTYIIEDGERKEEARNGPYDCKTGIQMIVDKCVSRPDFHNTFEYEGFTNYCNTRVSEGRPLFRGKITVEEYFDCVEKGCESPEPLGEIPPVTSCQYFK